MEQVVYQEVNCNMTGQISRNRVRFQHAALEPINVSSNCFYDNTLSICKIIGGDIKFFRYTCLALATASAKAACGSIPFKHTIKVTQWRPSRPTESILQQCDWIKYEKSRVALYNVEMS